MKLLLKDPEDNRTLHLLEISILLYVNSEIASLMTAGLI
jgi:hypothetical protein